MDFVRRSRPIARELATELRFKQPRFDTLPEQRVGAIGGGDVVCPPYNRTDELHAALRRDQAHKRTKGLGRPARCEASTQSRHVDALRLRRFGMKPCKLDDDCVLKCVYSCAWHRAHRIADENGIHVTRQLFGVSRQQIEGAALMGTSLAFYGEITATNGVIDQSNFDTFQVARINVAPRETHAHIMESDAPPAGVGEPGLPPFAPALCNAIFAATGKRIRALPLSKAGLA